MTAKTPITHRVDSDLYNRFRDMCKERGIKVGWAVENAIKAWVRTMGTHPEPLEEWAERLGMQMSGTVTQSSQKKS